MFESSYNLPINIFPENSAVKTCVDFDSNTTNVLEQCYGKNRKLGKLQKLHKQHSTNNFVLAINALGQLCVLSTKNIST